jgi:DNA repair protein RadD
MNDRDYQNRADKAVMASWAGGARSVLLVSPTGSGKSKMGEDLASRYVERGERVLWVAHRRDLVEQAASRLVARFGFRNIGVIMPGGLSNPSAIVQVGSTQTLLRRGLVEGVKLLVPDEAHHYAAAEWQSIASMYAEARVLGLTATPWRTDATALGDIFESLVVAADYSELVRDGYLVPVCMYRPARALGSDLAEDVLPAWLRLSGGAQTMVFCARVETAKTLARQFREAGVPAAMVEGDMARIDRVDAMAKFRRGALKVLTNVNTLTEGIDVPDCACVVLARNFEHPTSYIQATGRALRPALNKKAAIIIDLSGCSNRLGLGLPTDDRSYDLDIPAHVGGEAQGDRANGPGGDFAQVVIGEPLVHIGVTLRTEPIEAIARDVAPARRSRGTMTIRAISEAT